MNKAFPRAILAAAALAGFSAHAQTTSFAAMYTGAGTSGGSCSSSYAITAVEPSTAGTYPVFIYLVGTTENHDNAAAKAAVNAMAAKGYVAASVDYATSQFGTCSVLAGKANCIFKPDSPSSAVSQLCSRAKADCSKGIVVAGFSQGSVLALLAKNFDARVQAVYGLGMSDKYSAYDLSSCVTPGKRTLASDRLRAVDGERDNYAGGSQAKVQSALQALTGLTCPAGSYGCLSANQSGWVIAGNRQVADGSADHCYTRASGDCFGSQNSVDAAWNSGSAAWAKDPNLSWLAGFTRK